MSEKRFEIDGVEVERFMLVFGDDGTRIVDNQTGKELYAIDVVGVLNEQQDTITLLKIRLEKINGGYGHLTHKNGLTPNEWLLQSQEQELRKKNERIHELIEEYGENIAEISKLQYENKTLRKTCRQLQDKIDFLCEVFDYGSDESIQKVKKYEKSKIKVMKNDKQNW